MPRETNEKQHPKIYVFRSFMKQFSLCSILRNTATNYFKRSNTNKWGSQTYLQAEVCREKRSFLFCLTASSQSQYVEQEAWQVLPQWNNFLTRASPLKSQSTNI